MSHSATIGLVASMGPRPDGHGEYGVRNYIGEAAKLQWGRDLMVTESMGKKQGRTGQNADASMGPRPDGHGELPLIELEWKTVAPLQWGRDLMVTES